MGNRGRRRGGADAEIPLPTGSRPTVSRSLPTRAERRKLARRVKRRRRSSAVREIPLLIMVALLIALVLKTFLVQAFVIPSGSMEQTIRVGDRVLVDKLTPWFGSRPQRGDVVVFKDPGHWLKQENVGEKDSPVVVKQVKEALTFIGLLPSDDEQDLIKRVIGVGGDTVKCCDKDGRITVNGVPLDEPYLHPGNPPSLIKFEVKVPAGRVFVMGDHRSNSADSRYHLDEPDHGTVSEDEVVGRAVWIAWPFGHWRKLEEPATFGSVTNARAGSPAASGSSNSVSYQDPNGMIPLPTPAELPLVMGVVGLHRLGRRRWHGVRSGCGGFGGRRTIRTRRTRRPAGQSGGHRVRRDGRPHGG
ncbi:signal peptidase I [Streptomyces sp. NBC_01217]|uniref:signal peptidase I n=1 Tax=Streptomyces sp. NBC_01217 TaxID=2903779 RepID=UPI002E16393F|nr:signal peptidase I [Streptomyces sp. NBC_01217]